MDGNSPYAESGCVKSGLSGFSTRGPRNLIINKWKGRKKSPKTMKKAGDFLGWDEFRRLEFHQI